MKINLLSIALLLFSSSLLAQEVTYGFKAGLSFSKWDAPSEMSEDGAELEEFGYETGFHVGGGLIFGFTDRFGLKTELLFSQRGVQYAYAGPSYRIYNTTTNVPLVTTGRRETNLSITQSYIEIPIVGYARFNRIEFQGGISGSALVSANGAGEIRYTVVDAAGNEEQTIITALDYSYYNDEAGGAPTEETQTIDFGGNRVVVLPTTEGAYFDEEERGDAAIRTLDVGVVGGLNLYLNSALYVGGRLYFGLLDVTRNEYDYSLRELAPDLTRTSREDIDRNFTIQASIGFSF